MGTELIQQTVDFYSALAIFLISTTLLIALGVWYKSGR